MKISFNHLKDHIKENNLSIHDVSEKLFQLGHENTIKDNIFDIEFTPNRGDCLSVSGLARDLKPFYKTNDNLKKYEDEIPELDINFENKIPDECKNITFLELKISHKRNSYKNYLERYFQELNINKNNFFTDISNYLNYELGQPTHCYDLNKIDGEIRLEQLKKQVTFRSLQDKDINLTGKNNVFIVNDEVINLAGIMGGKSTACESSTNHILVECANFLPDSIINKSIKYDLNSEAAYKFERGVDPSPKFQENVLRRFIYIVGEHATIEDIKIRSFNYQDINNIKIDFDLHKVNKILGTCIKKEQFVNILESLGFEINKKIHVPSHRTDIKHQNDIAEEIARVIGYDNINVQKLKIEQQTIKGKCDNEEKLKSFLVDEGFNEVINLPFSEKKIKDSIKIDNPLDINKSYFRKNILDSLIENLSYNERRQKNSVKMFEISDIYSLDSNHETILERRIGIIYSGIMGKNFRDFSKKMDESFLKDLLSKIKLILPKNVHLISREHISSKSKSKIYGLELNINELPKITYDIEHTKNKNLKEYQYSGISDFPSATRDVSFLTKDPANIKNLEDVLLNAKTNNLVDVFVFDFYTNKETNEIKIGFRFIFQSYNETLSDEIIDDEFKYLIKMALDIGNISVPGM